MNNPLKSIFDIRKNELPFALLMALYFFFVITSFWILKPIKKALFIDYYKLIGTFELWNWQMLGSQAELLAKILNMVVAALAVTVFTLLSRRFRRQRLTLIFSLFFIVSYLGYSLVLQTPSEFVVWTFYLFGDLYTTLMVATFFVFLNDSVSPDAARRLYGLVGFGGVAGGVFGTTSVRAFLELISNSDWMFVLVLVTLVIIAIALVAGRMVDKQGRIGGAIKESPTREKQGDGKKTNAALEGAKLVFSSKYLLAIVGIVGFYEMVSTIMDFQFSATVEHFVKGSTREHFSTVFAITNVSALVVQLFLTSFVMTRFGPGVALMVLPAAALLGSAGFLIFPTLLLGSSLNTADNAFSYSINQSAKESLYVPASREEKYNAKAFIDMFVQRFAKSLAVGLSLAITAIISSDFGAVRWLSLLTILILVCWIVVARYAGRRFDELISESE